MKKNFILVRHGYDDHSYIDGKNDTSLTIDGILVAKDAAIKLASNLKYDDVIIRHSIKKRGCETAEIFREVIAKKGINCICINEPGLTELFQGNFDFEGMLHEDKINFLQSCWDDFELCRMNGNLEHRFGQNKNREIILTLGENHTEWSVRIANGMLNIISDLEKGYQSINIAHRGVIYEIEQLVRLSNNLILFDDVEKYKTRWMSYCQDYVLELEDLENSKKLVKKYQDIRSKK